MKLQKVKIGKNHIAEEFNKLNSFVLENFDVLFEGAARLGKEIREDYYAPDRVQINNTRLHRSQGLKIADGWHSYNDLVSYLTEENLKNTIKDLKILLNEAEKEIKCSFTIEIIKKED